MKRALAFLLGLCVPVLVAGAELHFCKRNTSCTIHTVFYEDAAPEDIQDAPTFADADIFHICDGGTESTGDVQAADITDEGQSMSISLAAADVDGEECHLTFIDQTATKTYLDKHIIIVTYGTTGRVDVDDFQATSTTIAAGGLGDAALAGNLEVVFETDFATNYNATRNAWVTNYTDTIGTDPVTSFDPPTNAEMEARTLVAASYFDPAADTVANVTTTATATSVTNGVTLANGAITNASLAGNMEVVYETDFATNYNATRNAWVTNYTDTLGTDPVTAYDPPTNTEMNARTLVAASYFDPAADTVATVTDVTNLHASAATSAAQTTAQNDLDILTGTDGATLATAQANYAPLKPTTAGRTLDVTATGEAGVDLDNAAGQLDAANMGEWAVTDTGTAAAVAAGTITLDGTPDFAADETKGQSVIVLSATTGAGQCRHIESMTAAEVVTLSSNWDTTPTGTVTYAVVPSGVCAVLAEVSDTTTPLQVDASGYMKVSDGTGTGQIDTDSGTVLLRSATETQIDDIETDATAILADTGTAGVLVSDGTGAGQIALTSGAIDTVNALAADAIGSGDIAAAELANISNYVLEVMGAIKCTVDSTNGAPTTTTAICDLTLPYAGTSVTGETDVFIGRKIVLTTSSAAPPQVGNYAWISDSSWNGGNSELTLTYTYPSGSPLATNAVANTDVWIILP